MTIAEGQLLWTPSEEVARNSNITAYMNWLRDKGIVDVDNYDALWRWSVDNIEAFWGSLWAPPRGSGIIPSIMPSFISSGAVSLSDLAALGALALSRHSIAAHPSGDMTE